VKIPTSTNKYNTTSVPSALSNDTADQRHIWRPPILLGRAKSVYQGSNEELGGPIGSAARRRIDQGDGTWEHRLPEEQQPHRAATYDRTR
jgi:hypothetical protein